MPATYNVNIGPAINHIVIPLPSGVITAPKITITTIAYRIFFRQNDTSIIPEAEQHTLSMVIEMIVQMLKEIVKQMTQNPLYSKMSQVLKLLHICKESQERMELQKCMRINNPR